MEVELSYAPRCVIAMPKRVDSLRSRYRPFDDSVFSIIVIHYRKLPGGVTRQDKREREEGKENAIPPEIRPNGIFVSVSREKRLLLLVVDRGVFDLLAFGIGTAHRDSAALAIWRHHNVALYSDFAIFLVGQLGRPVIHFLVRSHI